MINNKNMKRTLKVIKGAIVESFENATDKVIVIKFKKKGAK